MLFPMMPMMGMPPTEYGLKVKPWLHAVLFGQMICCMARFLIGDVWGAISDSIVVSLGYFAVSDMAMMYMLWYSIICSFNFLFDLVYLAIRVLELKSNYFLAAASPLFNLASATLLAAPILAATGAVLSYMMYKDFRDHLGEQGPLMNPLMSGLPIYDGAPYVGPSNLSQPTNTQGEVIRPFEGKAHRLD